MKKVILFFSWLAFLNPAIAEYELDNLEMTTESGATGALPCSIPKFLNENGRLTRADKNIDFIRGFKYEDKDTNIITSYPEFTKKSFILDNNVEMVIEHIDGPKPIIEEDKKIGFSYTYVITSPSDEKAHITIYIKEFNLPDNIENYCLARTDFLLTASASTMIDIPFTKAPIKLGSASVIYDNEISDFTQITWMERNLYFNYLNHKFSKEIFLKTADWVAKQTIESRKSNLIR